MRRWQVAIYDRQFAEYCNASKERCQSGRKLQWKSERLSSGEAAGADAICRDDAEHQEHTTKNPERQKTP